MRFTGGHATRPLLLALLAVIVVGAPAPAQSDPPKPNASNAPVVTVGDKQLSAAEMHKVLDELPPEVRANVPTNPKAALEFYFLAKYLASLGEEAHLDQESPYKEELEGRRLLTLANAHISDYAAQLAVTENEKQAFYEANKSKYPQQAEIRVITLYFSANPAPDAQGKKPLSAVEAKALAQSIHDQVAGGADFDALQARYSQDPTSNHGLIRREDKFNDSLKAMIFSMKPGEVSEPIEQSAAYYVVKLDQIGPPAMAQLGEELVAQVKQQKIGEYIKGLQKRFTPTIDDAVTGAATVDGKQVTAAEVKTMLDSLPAEKQLSAKKNVAGFLQEYFLVHYLASLAGQAHLDTKSPYREQLAHVRMQLLYNAELTTRGNLIQVQVPEQEKYYQDHVAQYQQAVVRTMMVFFTRSGGAVAAGGHKLLTEGDALALAEKIRSGIHEAADFDKLHDEYPNDTTTESVTLRRTSRQYADAVKNRIFALKPGEVSEPIRQTNAFYIVRTDKLEPIPYTDVRDEIFQQIRQQRFNEWVEALRKQFRVTIDDPGFFQLAAR